MTYLDILRRKYPDLKIDVRDYKLSILFTFSKVTPRGEKAGISLQVTKTASIDRFILEKQVEKTVQKLGKYLEEEKVEFENPSCRWYGK